MRGESRGRSRASSRESSKPDPKTTASYWWRLIWLVRRFLKECVYRRKAYARAPAEEENRGVRVTSLSITERLIFS